MATETEQLVVSLEARIRDFERNFQKASGTAGKNFTKIESRSKMATDRLESHWAGLGRTFGGIGKSLAAGLIGGLVAGGIMGISGRLNDIARSVASIGDEARRAGLGIEAFQELKYVAEQNRLGVDSLVDGIKELNLRADEFISTGGGSAAEAFQRLGYDAETLSTKLQDPSTLFTEIIGKLGHLDKAAQIRIADEIFGGTGGEKFVQLIEQGEDAINRTRQEARDLGVVMDDQLIAKANELDRAFQTVATTVGSTLQQAIVNAGWALFDFMQQFQEFEKRSTVSLENRFRELGQQRVDLEHAILEQSSMLRNMEPDIPGALGGPRAGLEANIAGLRDNMEAIAAEEASILEVLNSRTPVQPPPTQITVTNDGGTEPTSPGSGSGGGRSASSMREQRDAAAELIAELQNELAVLGMSEMEQRVNEELRRAGAFATDDQANSIRELVAAIETERGALERLEQASENAKGMAKDFLSGLASDLRSGVDGATALANAFGRLADRLMDMALTGIVDSLFSNLGSVFSFLKFKEGGIVEAASGGYIRGPGTGTSDSIPARLSNGEYVVNAQATRQNLDLLQAINSGRIAQFATGGLAGKAGLSTGRDRANINVGDINITTQGSSGDPTKDREHAEMIAKQVDQALEKKMAAWALNQTRPGGMFGDLRR